MNVKINLKWPKTPDNDFLPWYCIIWNLLWAVPLYIGRIIFCAAGAMIGFTSAFGPSFADLWDMTD